MMIEILDRSLQRPAVRKTVEGCGRALGERGKDAYALLLATQQWGSHVETPMFALARVQCTQ